MLKVEEVESVECGKRSGNAEDQLGFLVRFVCRAGAQRSQERRQRRDRCDRRRLRGKPIVLAIVLASDHDKQFLNNNLHT